MVWFWVWFLTDELDQAWILGLTNMQTFTCATLLFCVNTTWTSILTQKLNALEPCIWLHNVWYKMNCRILITTMYGSLPDFSVWITITLLQWASPWMEVLRNLLEWKIWVFHSSNIAVAFFFVCYKLKHQDIPILGISLDSSSSVDGPWL